MLCYAGDPNLNLAQLASKTSKKILSDVDATLSRLKRLVQAGSTLLSEMSVVFDNVVNFHLFDWFMWLTEWVEQQGGARASSRLDSGEGAEGDVGEQLGVSEPSVRSTLALASLSKEIGEFVAASALPMVNDSSDVTTKLRQSTSLLVRAFVDGHATRLSAAVLRATENATWTSAPVSDASPSHNVRQVILDLLTAASAIAKEVASVTGELPTPATHATQMATTGSAPPLAPPSLAVTASGGANTYRRYTRTGPGKCVRANR
jgi:hypothetical protein